MTKSYIRTDWTEPFITYVDTTILDIPPGGKSQQNECGLRYGGSASCRRLRGHTGCHATIGLNPGERSYGKVFRVWGQDDEPARTMMVMARLFCRRMVEG